MTSGATIGADSDSDSDSGACASTFVMRVASGRSRGGGTASVVTAGRGVARTNGVKGHGKKCSGTATAAGGASHTTRRAGVGVDAHG